MSEGSVAIALAPEKLGRPLPDYLYGGRNVRPPLG